MTRLLATCVLAVLLAGCETRPPGSPSTNVQPPPQGNISFSLSGTVSNSLGVPVEGATVEAVGQFNCDTTSQYPDPNLPSCYADQVLGAAATDGGGRFTISGLPAVYVRLDVHKNGNTVSQGVQMSQDSTVAIVIP